MEDKMQKQIDSVTSIEKFFTSSVFISRLM